MSDYKKYEDLLKERQTPEQSEKLDKQLLALIPINENTSLIVKNFGGQSLSTDLKEVPEADAKLALCSDILPTETKKKLATITDELVQGFYSISRRRTDFEKKMSVLQSNRFTTNSAAFHQANLEQAVQNGNLIDGVLNYERDKLKLQKMFNKHKKLNQKIDKKIQEGRDVENDQIDVQLLEIEMRRKISALKNARISVESTANELLEWSEIKEEKYNAAMAANEHFSAENVNVGQEIPLAQRFFQNYITAHKTATDSVSTSDILNIDGLALSAMTFGMKNGTLGKMMESLNDEQIQFLFSGIYGADVQVIRQGPLPVVIFKKADGGVMFLDKTFDLNLLNAPVTPIAELPETIVK